MSQKQAGVVLLTTILMIAILTLLILSLMQGVFLYIKGCNQIVTQHQSFYQMEAIANKLDVSKRACLVNDKDPNQLIDVLLTQHGCTFIDDKQQYWYAVEDLNVYPCLQITDGERVYSSHHWLITLATIHPQVIVLQLRIATIANTEKCEQASAQLIQSGVLTWRKA